MPSIKWETGFDLRKFWIIPEELNTATTSTSSVRSLINKTTFYLQIVTFSIKNEHWILKSIKQGFKKAVSWNKYISEITPQPKPNNLDHMMTPTFILLKDDLKDPTISCSC